MQDKAQLFIYYYRLLHPDLRVPEEEYRFYPVRRWRFDFAWVDDRVAVEVEGNAWRVSGGGKHMQDADMEKYNMAVSLGWRVFRFSPGMIERDPEWCIGIVMEALGECVIQYRPPYA